MIKIIRLHHTNKVPASRSLKSKSNMKTAAR
jgi:hypothetical protein